MALIYTEFVYPIKHYFATAKWNEFIFDIVLPLIIGIIAFLFKMKYNCVIELADATELFKSVITLMSILVGFTISSITILSATSEKLNVITERKIKDKPINLYQLTNIIFIFTLLSEIVTLIVNLLAIILLSYKVQFIQDNLDAIILLDIILISHVLLLNVRNITNFYFILHNIKSD